MAQAMHCEVNAWLSRLLVVSPVPLSECHRVLLTLAVRVPVGTEGVKNGTASGF